MIILGDSHVRSFSYSKFTFPIFLASGKKLLLNKKEHRVKTIEIISDFIFSSDLYSSSSDELIYLLIGEPSIRSFLESGEVDNNYAQKYFNSIKYIENELEIRFGMKFCVFPPIPRKDKKYSEIWLDIIEIFKKNNRSFSSCFDYAVDNGILLDEFYGDFIHGNEKLADLLISKDRDCFLPSGSEFKWLYAYENSLGATVWGEADVDFLYYKGTLSRDFSLVKKKSAQLKSIIDKVNLYTYILKLNICTDLLSDDEGFWTSYSSDNVNHYFTGNQDSYIKERSQFLEVFFKNRKEKNIFKNNSKVIRKVIFCFDKYVDKVSLIKWLDEYDEVMVISSPSFFNVLMPFTRVKFSTSDVLFTLFSRRKMFLFKFIFIVGCKYEKFLRILKKRV